MDPSVNVNTDESITPARQTKYLLFLISQMCFWNAPFVSHRHFVWWSLHFYHRSTCQICHQSEHQICHPVLCFTVEHHPKAQQHSPPEGLLIRNNAGSSSPSRRHYISSVTQGQCLLTPTSFSWTTELPPWLLLPWSCCCLGDVLWFDAVVMAVVSCEMRCWYGDNSCDVSFSKGEIWMIICWDVCVFGGCHYVFNVFNVS